MAPLFVSAEQDLSEPPIAAGEDRLEVDGVGLVARDVQPRVRREFVEARLFGFDGRLRFLRLPLERGKGLRNKG